MLPASPKDPEGWSAADKFTLVLETAGLNATELSTYCRERGLFPEQVDRWRKAAATWPWPACHHAGKPAGGAGCAQILVQAKGQQ